MLRFVEHYRAILQADIWIHRPTGSVCREKKLTKLGLLKDIAADFALRRLWSSQYPAGSHQQNLLARFHSMKVEQAPVTGKEEKDLLSAPRIETLTC